MNLFNWASFVHQTDVLPASFLALPHFNCHVTSYPPISYRGFEAAANCAIRRLVESLSRQRQKLHCVGAASQARTCNTYSSWSTLTNCDVELYLTRGSVPSLSIMSSRSTRSAKSQASSAFSSTTMTTTANRHPPHPYLTPGRASTISTWQSTLFERKSQPHLLSKDEEESHRAAVQAYQELRLSLFSRAATPAMSRPS
jgi:hypothetical protein